MAVGLVAGSVLALQVLLTRLFSAALFYHFSFLSISLALLGAGAGAIAVYVRPQWFDRRPLERAAGALVDRLAGCWSSSRCCWRGSTSATTTRSPRGSPGLLALTAC